MGGIHMPNKAGLNNLYRGIKDVPDQIKKVMNPRERAEWTQLRVGSLGMKALGGLCMFAGASAGFTALAAFSIPAGIIGGATCIGLTVLGYDLAEVGTNLGKVPDLKGRDIAATFTDGLKAVSKSAISIITNPVETTKKIGESDPKKTIKNIIRAPLEKDTIIFGRLFSNIIWEIGKDKLNQ